MKRGGPLRRSPLARTTMLGRPNRLRRTPLVRKARAGIPRSVWREVRRRSGGRCERGMALPRCPDPAAEMHHVLTRARGGKDTAANLLHLCSACHRWTHDHPRLATELGLLRHSWAG